MHLPPIVFLDEPTEGLDPRSRAAHSGTRSTQLQRRLGVTLVLTTHYMDEGDRLCDRIGIIDGGRIVAEGTPGGAEGGGRRGDARGRLPATDSRASGGAA